MTQAIVLGAGISGLSVALELQAQGVDVKVLEASQRPGGAIGSIRHEGFLAELGPHTVAGSNAAVETFLHRTGLSERRLVANAESKRRFAVRDGRVFALPGNPLDLLKTEYLSGAAKLALLREPLAGPARDDVDESVTMFVKRRLGEEILEYGIDLMINGIWAGDPNRLSMRHAFRKVWGLESDYGSLIKGGIKKAKAAKEDPGPKFSKELFSFPEGNQELALKAAAMLDVEYDANVVALESGKKWSVKFTQGGKKRSLKADLVVSALPGWVLADLPIDKMSTGFLHALNYPSLAVETFAFRREDVDHPIDGFGMLVPKVENRRILGALFTSSLFSGRAPDGYVTMAVFSGGLRDPQMSQMPRDARRKIVLAEVADLLGVHGSPVWEYESYWEEAIPQYEVGHGRIVVEIEALERRHPGFFVSGNFRDAVSVPDLIASGTELGQRAAQYLD